MGGASSLSDPIFWLHHAFIDKIWADWQKLNPTKKPSNLSEQLQPPPIFQRTVGQVMSTTSMGYVYVWRFSSPLGSFFVKPIPQELKAHIEPLKSSTSHHFLIQFWQMFKVSERHEECLKHKELRKRISFSGILPACHAIKNDTIDNNAFRFCVYVNLLC